MVCGGRGSCADETCVCNDSYEGHDCSCKKTKETCKAPGSNSICSGVGDCVCGECVCREVNGIKYDGIYCDVCENCSRLCEIYEGCVISTIHGKEDGSCVGEDTSVFIAKNVPEINKGK